jgi:hypothetical protein
MHGRVMIEVKLGKGKHKPHDCEGFWPIHSQITQISQIQNKQHTSFWKRAYKMAFSFEKDRDPSQSMSKMNNVKLCQMINDK